LYRIGGVSAFVFVAMVLIPLGLLAASPMPPERGEQVLQYISKHPCNYMAQLICFVGLTIPAMVVFAALGVALANHNPSLAFLGAMFGVTSEAVGLAVGASPQSLHGGLLLLSGAYAKAATDTERAGLVSAAEALIALANAMP
jgi:hypothetical protein